MTTHTQSEAKSTSTPIPAMPPAHSGLLPQQEQEELNRSLLSSEDQVRSPSSANSSLVHSSSVNHSFGAMAIGPTSTPVLQRKLTIGQPNDQYEQEADQVADQVMRMPAPKIQRLCPECKEELQRQPMAEEEKKKEEETLQTKPLAGAISPLIQRQMEPTEEEKKKKEEETLQTKPASGEASTASPALQNQITALQGGGQPLPESERRFFEPRFGTDFSQVRVHAGGQAAEAARAVNARAFTLGRDVVFGAGEYQPRSNEGQLLLAHELTHVVQQGPRKANFPSFIQTSPEKAPEKGKIYPPVNWGIDYEKNRNRIVVFPKFGVSLEEIADFLYGNPAEAAELAAENSISSTSLLLALGQPLYLIHKTLTKTAFSNFETSNKIPANTVNPEAFLAKKESLDTQLEKDFQLIINKLDEVHYSDSDEGEVISILRKWGEKKFTTNPKLYPNGSEYLDELFGKLHQKRKDVGIITTQWTNYYSLIFNHFDRVNEVKAIRDAYSRKFRGDSGLQELSFGSFFWEQVKEGKIRDQIYAYFRGLAKAGAGLIEGVILLLTDPGKVLEAIGNLPSTIKVFWENRDKILNDFLNAKPEEQAEIIGRLFGEAELLILTVGAGSGGRAATAAPELATATEIVGMSGGAGVLSGGQAITINLGQLGVEAGRITALMSKASEVSVEGKKGAEELEAESKSKAPQETASGKNVEPVKVEGEAPALKQIYNSIKDAPNYPKDFRPIKNGTRKVNINNKSLLEALRKIEPGDWYKIYRDGYSSGERVSIHYCQSRSGKVFDVKTKLGWSNLE